MQVDMATIVQLKQTILWGYITWSEMEHKSSCKGLLVINY